MSKEIEWFVDDSEDLVSGFKGKFEGRDFKLFFNHSKNRAILYMLDGKPVPKELAKNVKKKMDEIEQFKGYDLSTLKFLRSSMNTG